MEWLSLKQWSPYAWDRNRTSQLCGVSSIGQADRMLHCLFEDERND